MKNVTVTMPEEVAQWARVEAARCGKSVSRFLGDMLVVRMAADTEYRNAQQRFLGRGARNLSGAAAYPTRGAVHER